MTSLLYLLTFQLGMYAASSSRSVFILQPVSVGVFLMEKRRETTMAIAQSVLCLPTLSCLTIQKLQN